MQSQIVRRSIEGRTGWATTFTSALRFTPETVSKNLELAKTNRSRLGVVGTWIPWSVLGLGLFFSVGGAVLWALRRRTVRGAHRSDHRAATPSPDI